MNTRKRTVTQSPNIFTANVKICRLVAGYPCLYDRSNADYLRKSAVINVWKEISKEMKHPVKVCQQRWRNIRTSYARSMKDHPGANTYYLRNELEFLQNHITPGVPPPSRGRRSRVGVQEDEQDQTDEDHKPDVLAFEVKHAQSSNGDGPDDADIDSDEETEQERGGKRLRLSKEDVQPSISNGHAARILDFDDAFLQGLRPEIEQMNFNQKLYFKRRVYDLLGEIFPTEEPTPSVRSEMASEMVPAAATSTPTQLYGLKLQLPKLKSKPDHCF